MIAYLMMLVVSNSQSPSREGLAGGLEGIGQTIYNLHSRRDTKRFIEFIGFVGFIEFPTNLG